jgi:hypothetical protein
LEYTEEHSKQRNSSRYRKTNYLEEHDMEWHGDYVRQNRDLKLIGINKILVSQLNAIYLRHSCKDSIEDRAFSHGCIRVEKPVELATQILKMIKMG